MLIHEVQENSWGVVDGALFVRPEGCSPQRVPEWAEALLEQDLTLSLRQPMVVTTTDGSVKSLFIIHGTMHLISVSGRAA